ncbi:MAG TPA: alpha/beta fold hydrolase [Terriglobales bacterium]|nr:alpha/beta fold hydrolase [Terriglobales bacterium]
MQVRSNDTEIVYSIQGDGPPVVLLHPFPLNHRFWMTVAERLSPQYKLIMPDLRGLGASAPGDGPATMEKHADDLRKLCDDARVGKVVFVGVSIGGYILFEFWRRYRDRVTALGFCNTRAGADTEDGRKGRLESVKQIEERGTERFIDAMLPKLIGETTKTNRPDIVAEARRMAMEATGRGLIANQLGMAERQDSITTLATIDVPTLCLAGSEDILAPAAEIERIHKGIRGSGLRVIQQAGHFAALERPEEFSEVLREFLMSVRHIG